MKFLSSPENISFIMRDFAIAPSTTTGEKFNLDSIASLVALIKVSTYSFGSVSRYTVMNVSDGSEEKTSITDLKTTSHKSTTEYPYKFFRFLLNVDLGEVVFKSVI